MLDVVALGELLIDFTCLSVDEAGYPTLAAHPGGAPANFLAALAKFGAQTAMIGKVGQDAFGQMLTRTLREAGIETSGLAAAEDVFTTLAFVILDEEGNREFSFARKPGADTRLTREDVNFSLIDRTRVLHFGTLSLTDEPARSATQAAVAYAKQRGALVPSIPTCAAPCGTGWRTPKSRCSGVCARRMWSKSAMRRSNFCLAVPPRRGRSTSRRSWGFPLCL